MTVCSATPTECWLVTQDCKVEGIYVWESRSLWAAGQGALERDGQELCGQGLLDRLCPLHHPALLHGPLELNSLVLSLHPSGLPGLADFDLEPGL